MRRKMLYLMHTDWNWIKQRPHFLAEELAKYYDIDLYFVRNPFKKGLARNQKPSEFKTMSCFVKIPYSGRLNVLKALENLINRRKAEVIYKKNYYAVWVSSPIVMQFIDIQRVVGERKIYDCMDNISGFPFSSLVKLYLISQEDKLFMMTDLVIASSERLKGYVTGKGYSGKILMLNNAIDKFMADSLKRNKPKKMQRQENIPYNFLYFGTISDWFDFDIILKLLGRFKDIFFTLIGPCETQLPKHERIKYLGTVNHNELEKYAEQADAFIMPFKLNELILSVDPVKVYEYIAFLKPAFVVEYPETQKFVGFVKLYKDYDHLCRLIEEFRLNPDIEKGASEIIHFLESNTWEKRTQDLNNILMR